MNRPLATLACTALALFALPGFAADRSTITQEGSLSTATITQGPPSLSFGRNADIYQGPGTRNWASIEQVNLAADASITQYGNNERAEVKQNTDGARTIVLQRGDSNTATVNQDGAHGLSANVEQNGSRNSATITQNVGLGPFADLRQTGSDNTATITEMGVDSARATLYQTGSYNRASIDLPANSSQAWISQDGIGNLARISEQGTSNYAAIEQIGNFNLADIDVTGSYVDARITQHGNFNRGYITSFGAGNSADQADTAAIRQGGHDNLARITQAATFNTRLTAAISQNFANPGFGNVATILQR